MILRRVVVRVLHRQRRAARQRDGLLVAVLLLPVEIPALDREEPSRRAVRQCRVGLHFLPEIVRVRVNAQHVRVHGQHVGVGNGIGRVARGDVDRLRAELHHERHVLWGDVREEEAEAGLHGVRLPLRQQMQLHHQVAARIEAPRHPGGRDNRTAPGGPAKKMAVGILRALGDHPVVPRLSIRAVAAPRRARAIHADDGVVDDRSAAGTELDGANETAGRQRDAHHDVAEDVVFTRADGVGPRHGDDEIRLSKLPAVGPLRRLRTVCGLAFRRAFIRPALDRRDLRIGQAPLADEFAEVRLREPGRHPPRLRHPDDLLRALLDLPVLEQREGRRLVRAMTRRTAFEQDRRDVLVERGRRTAHFRGLRWLATGRVAPACHERTGNHQDARRSR